MINFWKGEKCEYCAEDIIDKIVDLPRKVKGKYILIKKVPVGVCKKCGTQYYSANVLKTIESSMERRKIQKRIPMAVYSF